MSFLQHTLLAVSSDNPTLFVLMGPNPFVDGLFSGDIEACLPSSGGLIGCHTVAVLTNTSGTSDGMAVPRPLPVSVTRMRMPAVLQEYRRHTHITEPVSLPHSSGSRS